MEPDPCFNRRSLLEFLSALFGLVCFRLTASLPTVAAEASSDAAPASRPEPSRVTTYTYDAAGRLTALKYE